MSSVSLDHGYASMYAEADVNEYWIVLAEKQRVEVRRRPVAGMYEEMRTYERGETLVCEMVPAIQVSLDALFAN